MRKEDMFSVGLKLYSIGLIVSIVLNYLQIKVKLLVAWSEIMLKNSELLFTPYHLWMMINSVILFFAIYIWYRANKILEVQSSIDFKSGAYLTLGFYWFFIGLYDVRQFLINTYGKYENQFNSTFGFDIFFEGFGILMVGGAILGYWFRRVEM